MQKTSHYRLISSLMNNLPARWPEHQTGDDVANFIASAQQHGVLALLSEYLPQLKHGGWPQLIVKTVAVADRAAEQITAQRKESVMQVLKSFSAHKIDALIFKGAANAYLLYARPHHRMHADIDILIRESQFSQVENCLKTLDFELGPVRPTKYGPSQTTAAIKAPGRTPITYDIHWKINNRCALANTLDFDELSKRAIPVSQYGGEARAFCYSDAVLAACIHEAGSLESEKNRLISLYDLHLLLCRLDARALEHLANLAKEKKIGAIYSHCLKQCLDTFKDDKLAKKVSRALENFTIRDDELSAKLLAGNRRWLNDQWLDICSIEGTLPRLEFILAKLKRKFS